MPKFTKIERPSTPREAYELLRSSKTACVMGGRAVDASSASRGSVKKRVSAEVWSNSALVRTGGGQARLLYASITIARAF